jgi:hypothetical protein
MQTPNTTAPTYRDDFETVNALLRQVRLYRLGEAELPGDAALGGAWVALARLATLAQLQAETDHADA